MGSDLTGSWRRPVLAIDNALKELTTGEMRAAEMLMAEDAASATKELLAMLDGIGQTIDDIRGNLRKHSDSERGNVSGRLKISPN